MRFRALLVEIGFLLLLSLIPCLVMAQEEVAGRLIDVPNVEKDNAKLVMTKELRQALSEAGHIVFTEEEMVAAARDAGLGDGYWRSGEDIAKVNRHAKHDAVVRIVNQKSSIVIYVINAYTGETLAELERKLKKKGKVGNSDAKAVARGVTQVVSEIVPVVYDEDIVVTIRSTPSGATVLRDGIEIGTTPLEIKVKSVSGASEQWAVTYPGREPALQLVSLEKSNAYDVNLIAKIEEPKRFGKIAGSTGRPIFLFGFNISPTIRSLKSSSKQREGYPEFKTIGYTSQTFPVYSFDVEFYPFPLFLNNDYLQGLGLIFNVGFGFLDSKLYLTSVTGGSKCDLQGSLDGDSGTYSCDTDYLRARVGLVYKLLFQKKNDRLNPDGLALDFIVAFNYSNYGVQENGYYSGHEYKGFNAGLRFSSPLGLSALRAALNFDVFANFGNGGIEKTTKWGNRIEMSYGIGVGLNFIYDIWKGIYARVGYEFTFMSNDYGGFGTIGSASNEPYEAETRDMYHEIMLGFGYMLY